MAVDRWTHVVALLVLLTPESDSQLNVCGNVQVNTRIVGGEVAPEGSWPWQVSVHIYNSHSCGGSLINQQWVLSAAHCFAPRLSPSDVTIYLGRQSQQGRNPHEVKQTVAQIINHPNYNGATFNNDMSLLQLSTPVTFTDYIRPVCLAAQGSTVHADLPSWVTGWGNIGSGVSLPYPQNLMEVEVPIRGNRECKCSYGLDAINDNMICAGVRGGGKDSCQGDSGGPLVMKQNNSWIQLGVVSFGRGCAQANFPGVYARVSQYQSWINRNIVSNQPGFLTFTSSGIDGDLYISCSGLPEAEIPAAPTTPTASQQVFCGNAPLNGRILDGNSAAAGTWPWMASLQKNGSHVCGGTLVSVNAVLSSADCFSSSPVASEWRVVLGRLHQNGQNTFEVTANVTNITLSNVTGSNIAVLHLDGTVWMSDYVQPICLDDGQTFAEGQTCWGAGWAAQRGGAEQSLQEFQTQVVSCGNLTGSNNICTESFTLEQGDAGGPLMCRLVSGWFQAAVLSLDSSGRAGRQNIRSFTKVSHFSSFLRSTLGTLLSPNTASTSTSSSTPASNTSTNATVSSPASTVAPLQPLFALLVVLSVCFHVLP